MTRAHTLVLALLVINFLLGALCLAVARGERASPALRLWGWATLIYAAGLAITVQRLLPGEIAFTLGNGLIAWSSILAVEGVLANTNARLDRRWAFGALAGVIGVLAYGNFSGNYQTVLNLNAPAAFAIVLFVYGAYRLVRLPPPAAQTAARFLAGTMLLAVVVWGLRVAFLLNIAELGGDRESIDLVISLFVIAQIVVSVACTLTMFWIEVRKMESVLIEVAMADPLTGLPNRRAIIRRFGEEESQAVRHGRQFGVLIFDVDNFKNFNDLHGHLTGDAVLCHVADCLARTRRAGDALGRMGGDEFVMIVTGDRAIVEGAAQRVRAVAEAGPFDCRGQMLSVTLSGGLAIFPEDGVQWDKLYEVADRRLYESKQQGRNRMTTA